MTIENWISNNKIAGNFITESIFEIENVGKFLIMPKREKVVDEEFRLILQDDEDEFLFHVDYFTFYFGSKWYYTHKDSPKATLYEFKNLGKYNTTLDIPDYSHLGIHGKFELMNGSRDYKDWCKKANFYGMKSLGISEYKTLAGTLYFQEACKENGIKSILGMTLPVKYEKYVFDVKLYVQNKTGWKNLLNINKILLVEQPTGVDPSIFTEYSDGLICVIGGSTIVSKLNPDIFSSFELKFFQVDLSEWKSESKDRSYLENYKNYFANHTQEYPPIFIQDSYYLDKDDSSVKRILNKIGASEFSYVSDHQYFKSIEDITDEFYSLFPDGKGESIYYQALENNLILTDECNFLIKREGLHLPQYEMNPDESEKYSDSEDLFFGLLNQGFEEKIVGLDNENVYMDRLDREVEVLREGQVIDYFLILADVVRFSKLNGIQVSTGRGSSAGSLVAYLLNITNIDPIKHGLLFERFLNKARLLTGSMPDIDHDCPSNKRDLIINYLRNKYGADNTALIGTNSNLKLKSLVKAFLSLKKVDFKTSGLITSLFSLGLSFEQSASKNEMFEIAAREPKLKEMIMSYPDLFELVDLMIFSPKSHSIHAAGIIITPKQDINGHKTNVWDYVPIRLQNGVFVTEFEKEHCEQIGLLKDDILGLTQLDKIDHMLTLIKDHYGVDIDLHNGPIQKDYPLLNDPNVYKLFQNGFTEDIFQFNTEGMKKYCVDLQPDCIEDLIAANSLYRPGAMESNTHTKFVEIKHQREEPEILVGLDDITKETYGLFCIDGNANIVTDKGCVKLKNIEIGDRVLTEDGTYQKVIKKFNNGIKKTVKLRTNIGEELICTPDHKVLTQNGWKEVRELNKRDIIKSFWLNTEKVEIGTEKDWIMGHWLGDGFKNNFATCSEDFARKLVTILQRNFPNVNNIHYEKFKSQCHYVRVTNEKGGWNSTNDFNAWIRSFNLWDKRSFEKFIPEGTATLMTLIGFMEADGNIANNSIRIKNESLAHQLLEIAQSYRIRGFKIKDKYNVDALFFNDTDLQLNYLIKDKIIIPRKEARPNIRIPFNILPIKEQEKVRKYGKCTARGYVQLKSAQKLNSLSIDVANEVGINYDHALWAKVLSIKDHEELEVFDISVENNHSYVAGGLVVHNCYQEQVMLVYQKLTNCDLNEADDFRKIITKTKPGKKNKDIERFETSFKDAYMKITNSADYVDEVWTKLINFSKYSFNKSHSAAYSVLAYYTAWLKEYYPLEFYSTSLQFAAKEEIRDKIIGEIFLSKKIKLVAPDINKSINEYTIDVDTQSIYWSLTGIKSFGEKTLEKFFEERKTNGKFYSFNDFISRMKNKGVNKKVCFNLIACGTFDEVEDLTFNKVGRNALFEKYNEIYESKPTDKPCRTNLKNHELDLLQINTCGYGLIDYQALTKRDFSKLPFLTAQDINNSFNRDQEFYTAGFVDEIIFKRDKNDKPYARLVLNQNNQRITVPVWTKDYDKFKSEIATAQNRIVAVTVAVEAHYRRPEENTLNFSKVGGRIKVYA